MRSLIRNFLVVLVLLLGAIHLAGADQFGGGLAAYVRGDYAEAVRLIRPLAEQGNASAQYRLGFMYTTGQGVPRDLAEAKKWFR